MEAFNRKDHPTLSGSIALQKSPHKLGGTQPWSCPVHVPALLNEPPPAMPSLLTPRGTMQQ